MAVILHTNGAESRASPANGTDFTLDELRPIVKGYIEIVQLRPIKMILVINEEGKLMGLPPNIRATKMWHENGGNRGDFIAGDALLCKQTEVR